MSSIYGKGDAPSYGIWATLREEYLRKEKPELFKLMHESGILLDHLRAYQRAYSVTAQNLLEEKAKERGCNEELMQKNYFEWFLLTSEISEEVREIVTKMVQS